MQTQDIVHAIQSAVSEVFSSMLGIEVEPCPYIQDASGRRSTDGVMSFVSVAGNWVGCGLFSCSATLACRLCSLFLMTESTHVDPDVLDAVGELANMIIGSFKTTAEASVGQLYLSIPTTIFGKSFGSKSLGSSEWIVMPFKCGEDTFEVWVWFAKAAESHTHHRQTAIQLQIIAPGNRAEIN
jgi:chemotaxis protein CheX